jgi:hypothetical protein
MSNISDVARREPFTQKGPGTAAKSVNELRSDPPDFSATMWARHFYLELHWSTGMFRQLAST